MTYLIVFTVVVVLVVAALYLFWKIVFLRNPTRIITEGDSFLSPADGKVVDVIKFEQNNVTLFKNDKRYKGIIRTITSDVSENGYLVSIFMSPLDVHFNRSPISGTVKTVVHSKGKFLPVNTLKAGLVNEKAEILIEGSDFCVKVIQVAGFLAKRIETFVKPGDVVTRGDIIGLINLGSQAILVLPNNVKVEVEKGEKVKAGVTHIAQIDF